MTDAVVMAAGEGRRLRPLTERWAKPVLPIDGRAVIATLLRELVAAGCSRATIVVGHLREQIEALVGDGSAFGLEVGYAHQPSPDGSADAVRRAEAAAPYLIAVADTAFRQGDVRRFASAAAATGAAGAMAVRRDPAPGPGRAAVRVQAGRVTRVPDDDPANPFAAASLWFLDRPLDEYLHRIDGPPYELAAAYQLAIDEGADVRAIEIGRTRDLTEPLDLVKENFPYLTR